MRADKTRWAIVAPTFTDARDTCAEGESGIVRILDEYQMLRDYNRSIGEIFLTNGSRIKLFSGEEPNRLRGPQHHGGWFDELAAFKYSDSWDQYQFGLRLGTNPRSIITTTPRPTKLIKDLLKRDRVLTVRGSTFDNAKNLPESALTELRARYEGTRLGRQELHGEVLEDTEGALWTMSLIEACRVTEAPQLMRVVVAVDPAVTSNETSDETGIVVAGVTTAGHFYILEDCSIRTTPDAWARAAVTAYHRHNADRIVAETNNGGDMVTLLMRQVDPAAAVKKVTATRGKMLRAEPVVALYEQGRVHHVGGFADLEDQMTSWSPLDAKSPDRLDALVWALTELSDQGGALRALAGISRHCSACGMPNVKRATICQYCQAVLPED